ncbi:MAG: GNAT family N-acetyltransferase [Alphaproteobacteria bacterium]|nr:GNAT family N-acetyltransferase [Alphaproteobacteria bacterium]
MSEADLVYQIMPATAAERERLAALPVFSMSAQSLGRKVARGDVLLAKVGEEIIGLLIAELYGFFDENVVSLIIVDEQKRRRGIGTALVEEAEKLFGKGKLFMATNDSNAPMCSLCDKMGYVKVGQIDVPGEDDPEIVYLKRL